MKRIRTISLIIIVLVSTIACRFTQERTTTPVTEEDRPTNAIQYGSESRQWLLIFEADANEPTPIFLWAHANGSTADRVSPSLIREMNASGVSVVSWESIPMIKTASDLQTGWQDAEVVLSWIKANADDHNLDANTLIIGGSSRGTGLSWQIAHSGDPAIKGIYMYNALPDGFWINPDAWDPVSDVSENSPPMFLAYGPAPGDDDIHDPENGMLIGAQYEALGLDAQFTLVHSLGASANTDPWQFLPEFVSNIIE